MNNKYKRGSTKLANKRLNYKKDTKEINKKNSKGGSSPSSTYSPDISSYTQTNEIN